MTDRQLSYCKVCTKKYFDQQRGILCSLTGEKPDFVDDCSTFAPIPGANLEKVGETPAFDAQLYLASGGKRFANMVIDTIVYYIFIFLFAAVIGVIAAIVFPEAIEQEDSPSVTLWSYVLVFTVYLFYYTMMEAVFGRTVGKLITGTEVVMRDGKTPGTGVIFKRSLSRLVPFEAFSFLGSDSRGWHDEWTDTYVIEKRRS